MLHTLRFSLQNAVYFIMLLFFFFFFLFTFYIQGVLKFKCKTPVPKGYIRVDHFLLDRQSLGRRTPVVASYAASREAKQSVKGARQKFAAMIAFTKPKTHQVFPVVVDISLRILFVSHSRVWGFVLYATCSKFARK
jgi:hypothetical protein